MSIKKSIYQILAVVGLFLIAYSPVYAGSIVKLTAKNNTYEVSCGSVGMIVDIDFFIGCTITKPRTGTNYGAATSAFLGSGYVRVATDKNSGLSIFQYAWASCPEGEEINPDTKTCEAVCEPPSEIDPSTGECTTPAFCDRDSTWDEIMAAEQSCADSQGVFTYECSDFFESLEMKCTQPQECVMGMPNWPDCMGDIDPTDPIGKPIGDFNPPTANPSAPKPPEFDKPEPDEVLPTETTDTAVLEAIQNLNRDNNAALNGINSDLNIGFADTNNQLANLNNTNNAIGQSIVDQMNQDYAIHQSNKDLMLQQTGAIMNLNEGLEDINQSITGQTIHLSDGLDGVTEAIGNLEQACEPTAANGYCENPHGMGTSLVSDIHDQINTIVDDQHSVFYESAASAASNIIENPMTGDIEEVINSNISTLIGIVDASGDCTPLSLPSLSGNATVIDCEFSAKFKSLFGFLLFVFTLWTLIDILLTGITPRIAGTQGHNDYIT
ncbi:hypothetical protein [Vibrio paucivorans]